MGMIRESLIQRAVGVSDDFRLRGQEVSRVEGFSDAVFGFAVTLLVVSLEVPQTFDELLQAMSGVLAFGVCFILLISVWFNHYRFFRRYGLADAITLWLNAVLLFVILLYVYPLKFLFAGLFKGLDDAKVTLPNGQTVPLITKAQLPELMLIYGLGFAAVFFVFALLYWNAYRQRKLLDLNEVETFQTQHSIIANLLLVGIGLLSVTIAVVGGSNYTGLSGFTYMLIAPVSIVHQSWVGRRARLMVEQHASAAAQ